MALTGAHRIAVDALSFDLGSPPAFDGVIQAHKDRARRNEGLDQPGQQQIAYFQVRPLGSVQHSVIVLEMLFAIQTHNSQDCGYSSLSWGQYGADQQDLGIFPNAFGKQPGKTGENSGIFAGQGKSRPPSWRKDAEAYLVSC